MANKKRKNARKSGPTMSNKRVRTDHPSSKSARDARQAVARSVFNTTELLENILKHQSIEYLMNVRRVCHKWNDVILGSTPLKRIMFLAPESDDEDDTTLCTGNPVLLKPETCETRQETVRSIPFTMENVRPGFLKSKSLYLDMFVTQPPVTAVAVLQYRVKGLYSDPYIAQIERVKNSKGVKVRDVLRAGDRFFGLGGWHIRYLYVPRYMDWEIDQDEGEE